MSARRALILGCHGGVGRALLAVLQLLPQRRPRLARRARLVGSGANPGLVNALVFVAVEELAARVGVQATMTALDLYAVLITEDDTSAAADDVLSDCR